MADVPVTVRNNCRPLLVQNRFGAVYGVNGTELRTAGERRVQCTALSSFPGQAVELHCRHGHHRATTHSLHQFRQVELRTYIIDSRTPLVDLCNI